jgi:anti-sigma factor RsiW
MNCSHETALLAYLDGELDALRALEVEAHLKGCTICSARQRRYNDVHQTLASGSLYFKAPAGLADSIRANLRQTEPKPKPVAIAPRPPSRPRFWNWAAAAAMIIVLLSLAGLTLEVLQRPSGQSLLAQEVTDSHVRSLMVNHLMDVPSTDQHTVKPWFNGKLDFAPVVKDFAPSGFPLTGGRLDYVHSRTVAALLYQRRQHIINLFEWPSSSNNSQAAPRHVVVKGYNVVLWTQAGMNYAAVSDLNLIELNQFVEKERTSP